MRIVCLFGPDGSGKSTLAKALAERLGGSGFRVKLSWMRGTHTLASLFARLLSRFEIFKGSSNPYYNISIPPNFRMAWQLIEFFSAFPILFFRFFLPSLYSKVVCERYVPDLLVWISLTTDDPKFLGSALGRFLLKLSSKVDVGIHVTARSDELIKRTDLEPSFINRQIVLYDKVAYTLDAPKLDTTHKTVEESLNELLKLMGSSCRTMPRLS
jgi:energy-coupling factor transporter ATP-binding protein EcfA2